MRIISVRVAVTIAATQAMTCMRMLMSNGSFGECIKRAQRKHLFTTELEALDQLLDDVTARRSHMRESIDVHSKEISRNMLVSVCGMTLRNKDDIQKAEFFRRERTLVCDDYEQHQGCAR